jgi:hypothetical protein
VFLDLLQRAEITQGTGPLAESKTLDLSTWNIIDWLHDTGRQKENEVQKIDLLIETQPTEGFDLEWKEKSKRLRRHLKQQNSEQGREPENHTEVSRRR